jgi:1-deoxy-D-xylulose-5-phosphate synthase
MAYEALNHIAVTRPERLVIVLNDNGRSYAPTVGGLAALANLAHYRIDPRYEKAKRTIGRMLRGIPLVGETADELAGRVKDAFKQILSRRPFSTHWAQILGIIDGDGML